MDATLVVERISKSFGDLLAVDDLSFDVAPGETFGLLGPNGAGKTTAISVVCGLLAADAGTVTVCGTRIRAGSAAGRRLIGYVPQELALYTDMSGRANLTFFGRLYGLRGVAANKRIDEVLDIVALRDRAGDRVEEYSGGMQRRLNIAAGLLHRPELLILDEPTVGIDPQSRNAILEAVGALGDAGMSIVYTTHYMEEAERLCKRVAIVDHGKLLACGTRRELIAGLGEHDLVAITVAGDALRAAAAVAREPGVFSATAADDHHVECMVDEASTRLPQLLGRLLADAVVVQNLSVAEPSLDTVFLHITGTALRD